MQRWYDWVREELTVCLWRGAVDCRGPDREAAAADSSWVSPAAQQITNVLLHFKALAW